MESATSHQKSYRMRIRRGFLTGGLMLLASAGLFWHVYQTANPPAATGTAPLDEPAAEQVLQAHLEQFLGDDARPILQKTKEKDLAAMRRALDNLSLCFENYKAGAPKFSDDLTGWGTRFSILWRQSVESAERKKEHTWTQSLVNEKFSKHVVSDNRLSDDLVMIMKQFAYDLEASRNEMLSQVQTRLQASNLPVELKSVSNERFRADFTAKLNSLLEKMPGQSVVVGVGSLTAGIVAEEAVRNLVRAVVAQLAVRLATTAAASGGATGGAAAAAGTGGTAIAPGVGTAIGLAAGFIVGALVDWWMTDDFKDEINRQCVEFLDATHQTLVSGDQGLQKMMEDQINAITSNYEEAISETLVIPSTVQP